MDERRERRRKKKAIVDPPSERAQDSEGDEASGDDHSTGRKKQKNKGKKGKALHIPAGLALMHGFSATNIGKNRLTVSIVLML